MINIKSLLGLEYYISPLDIFLKAFDRSHTKLSDSQRAEIQKYARLNKMRNEKNYTESKNSLWDKF